MHWGATACYLLLLAKTIVKAPLFHMHPWVTSRKYCRRWQRCCCRHVPQGFYIHTCTSRTLSLLAETVIAHLCNARSSLGPCSIIHCCCCHCCCCCHHVPQGFYISACIPRTLSLLKETVIEAPL
jgi:hypothetical protein